MVKVRTFLWILAVAIISYSTLTLMVTSLQPVLHRVENYNKETSRWSLQMQRERTFYKKHAEAMQRLAADDSSTIDWRHVRDDFDLHSHFDAAAAADSTGKNANRTFATIETRDLCGLTKAFQRYRDSVLFRPSPHVTWWKNPTDSKDPPAVWQEQGCSVDELKQYLDHPDTLAVMVTSNAPGVRALDHSKLFPITNGLWQQEQGKDGVVPQQEQLLFQQITEKLPMVRFWDNRTLPILIVGERSQSKRTLELQGRLVRSFGSIKSIHHPKHNTLMLYDTFMQAQFVLGVTGGDHDWVTEALALGAIPILEEEKRPETRLKNDFHRILFVDLPVVWIDSYDNLTPELLDMEYAAILHDAGTFQYERLTQKIWIDQALSKLQELKEQNKRDKEELARLMAKRREEKKVKRISRIPNK